MLLLLVFFFITVGIIWLLVELLLADTLNGFLDKKIMRRFLWLWLPFYALWRLSKEVIFKPKK
ncbi:MAG: hypothetical protein COX30_01110 [Candidatus Moranbacteria bacterium CG23_combo_of_CG06-09_8_20_14_all_39_10]|nr:MAG: hypothetical protein COX30_01110 [Candidatus Moranbacteria bacterium CG23_combo_of_CG06-09_8_20_14_all_39_10]